MESGFTMAALHMQSTAQVMPTLGMSPAAAPSRFHIAALQQLQACRVLARHSTVTKLPEPASTFQQAGVQGGGAPHLVHDAADLILPKQVRHLSGREDVVDVLQERLVLDLRLVKQERRRLVLAPSLPVQLLQVLPELPGAVVA